MTKLKQLSNNKKKQHIKILHKIKCYEGRQEEGFVYNYLGAKTRRNYFVQLSNNKYTATAIIKTTYPPFDEEYFEHLDLLESVHYAQNEFIMMELGAGWGKWIVNAYYALKQLNPIPYYLIGVEAEPTHFQYMRQHLKDNNVDFKKVKLFEGAVNDQDAIVGFKMGNPDSWYGQYIADVETKVKAYSLNTLLKLKNYFDLIDLDIESFEYKVLAPAVDELNKKVRKIHIGTHNKKVEEQLRILFKENNWINVWDYPCIDNCQTIFGKINFQNGVQTWLNPKFYKK